MTTPQNFDFSQVPNSVLDYMGCEPPTEFLEWHQNFLKNAIGSSPYDMNTLQISLRETEDKLKNRKDT